MSAVHCSSLRSCSTRSIRRLRRRAALALRRPLTAIAHEYAPARTPTDANSTLPASSPFGNPILSRGWHGDNRRRVPGRLPLPGAASTFPLLGGRRTGHGLPVRRSPVSRGVWGDATVSARVPASLPRITGPSRSTSLDPRAGAIRRRGQFSVGARESETKRPSRQGRMTGVAQFTVTTTLPRA